MNNLPTNVYLAIIDDFWSDSPSIDVHRVSAEPNHVGNICVGGVTCWGAADRDLLDYMSVDIGPDGRIHMAYTHDGDTDETSIVYASFMPPT